MYTKKDLAYSEIKSLKLGYPAVKPVIPEAVFEARKRALCAAMQQKNLDAVAIYADREHYANFKYYTGVDPRFEEALLVVHAEGDVCAALGNECLSLADTASIEIRPVFCQMFSLPSQPMDAFESIEKVLCDCGMRAGMRVGLIDWKLITERHCSDYRHTYSMPSYLVNAVVGIVGDAEKVTNETGMLIDPNGGLRLKAEVDAIAFFEFGACCASQSVMDMLDAARPGMSELELANRIQVFGQVITCHDYVVAGENTRRGLISPSSYVMKLGDDLVVSTGMEGGLTCRHAPLAYDASEVEGGEYYFEEIVKPYMATVFNWYEMIGLGVRCGDVYQMVQSGIPKEQFGWTLNPGHMIGYEEWMCSPIAADSDVKIESGMMFQMDIIPASPDYPTPNAEDGVAIADEALRAELAERYPEVYARIMARRKFAEEQIGLKLKPEVLPLSNCFAEFRPFVLRREKAVTLKR